MSGSREVSTVHTLCLDGLSAAEVVVELQHTGGLMQRIIMTGLPGGAVREARDRIRGCLEHGELPVPKRSILANFAPADLHKEGNGFDLPLAVGILALSGLVPAEALVERVLVGELALDGTLRPVRGALALALEARRLRRRALMLPWRNGGEASLVDGLRVEPVRSIQEALAVLGGAPAPDPPAPVERPSSAPDLADVLGQPTARRALEIAAGGGHNLLLVGPPGTGKTMLAQRLPGLLPPLAEDDVLAVSALHGLASGGGVIVRRPPWRAPHHSISRTGLVGGGRPLVPGEVSLAHRGVLFLDELPEFPRSLLEALRQPLEDGVVRIARVGRSAEFPCRVQLVAAMNPCPCGYLGHPRRGCQCTPHQVFTYRRRVSGPILDRFDLHVDVPVPDPDALLRDGPGESSADVAARVRPVRETRGASPPALDDAATTLLARAMGRFGLSARAAARARLVASTIAALDGRPSPGRADLEEALSFRLGLQGLLEPPDADVLARDALDDAPA